MEERGIAIVDIHGAFKQADMSDTMHLKIEGRLAGMVEDRVANMPY